MAVHQEITTVFLQFQTDVVVETVKHPQLGTMCASHHELELLLRISTTPTAQRVCKTCRDLWHVFTFVRVKDSKISVWCAFVPNSCLIEYLRNPSNTFRLCLMCEN